MSSRNFSGSTGDYCRGSVSGISYPLTIIEWCRYNTIGATGTTRWIFCEGGSADNFIAGRSQSDGKARLTRRGSIDIHTNTSNQMSAGSWHFIAHRLAGTNDAEVILDMDTGNSASSSTDVDPANIDRISFGKRDNASNSNPFDGQIAIWCAWNADLTNDELNALRSGAHPYEIRPDKIIHLYQNWGRVQGVVIDEVGRADLSINGTSSSDQETPGLTHHMPSSGNLSPASVVNSSKQIELRISSEDEWISVAIPITRNIAEYYFELSGANITLSESGGSQASLTLGKVANNQDGDLVIGDSPVRVSDLVSLVTTASRDEYEATLAARLAPIPSNPTIPLTSGKNNTIDLSIYVQSMGLGLNFTDAEWGGENTAAALDGSELTVSSSIEGTDTVSVLVSNDHPLYPSSTTLEINCVFSANENTFANGFKYYKELLNPARAGSSSTATDFPLLVFLTDDDLRTTANGGRIESSNGWDILFSDQANTPLDFEIESYDALTGNLIAWVRLPSWVISEAYFIRIYYGNSGVATSPSRPENVWQSELGVWDSLTGEDLTGRGSDLTPSGVIAGSIIGAAGDFDGSSRLGRSNVSLFGGLTSMTARTLVSLSNEAVGTDEGIVSHGPITTQDDDQTLVLRLDAHGHFGDAQNCILWGVRTNLGAARVESAADAQTTGELYLAGRYSTGSGASLWIDKALTTPSSSTTPDGAAIASIEGPFQIGAAAKDGDSGGLNGLIDRVLIRDEELTSDWLSAERDSLVHRNTFLGVGAEIAPGANLGPIAAPFYAQTIGGEPVSVDVVSGSYDPQESGLTVTAFGAALNGSVSESSGTISYTPNANFAGDDSFEYTLSDGANTSVATIRISVSASNNPGDVTGNQALFARGLFSGLPSPGGRNSPIKIGGNGSDTWRRYNDDEMLLTFLADISGDMEEFWLRSRACDPDRRGDRCGPSSAPQSNYSGIYCTDQGEYSTGNGPRVRIQFHELSGSETNPSLGTLVTQSPVVEDVVDKFFEGHEEYYRFRLPVNSRFVAGRWYGALVTPATRQRDYVSFNHTRGVGCAGPGDPNRAGPYNTNKWCVYNRRQKSGPWQSVTSDYSASAKPLIPSMLFKWRNQTRPYTGIPTVYREGGSTLLNSSRPLRAIITPETRAPIVRAWVECHRSNSGASNIQLTIRNHSTGDVLATRSFNRNQLPVLNQGTQHLWASVDLGGLTFPRNASLRCDLTVSSGQYEFVTQDAGKWRRGMQGGPFNLASLNRDWFPSQMQCYSGSGFASLGSEIGFSFALEHQQ